jgi:hypothetical protein
MPIVRLNRNQTRAEESTYLVDDFFDDGLDGAHDLTQEAGDEEDPAVGAGQELSVVRELDERPRCALYLVNHGPGPSDDSAGLGVGDEDPGVRHLIPNVLCHGIEIKLK